MFRWIRSLLGLEKDVSDAITQALKEDAEREALRTVYEADKPKKTAPIKSKKDSGECDFGKLTKTQLLAEAKHRGVKANASMKKQDILDKLNAETN